jgi:hypothetical protein
MLRGEVEPATRPAVSHCKMQGKSFTGLIVILTRIQTYYSFS